MNGWKAAKRCPFPLASKHQAKRRFILGFDKRTANGIKTEIPAEAGISQSSQGTGIQGTSKTFCVVGSSAREPLSSPVMSSSLKGAYGLITRPGLVVFFPFKKDPDAPLDAVVGNSLGVDSERRVVGVGAGGGGGSSGFGSFLGLTVAVLLVVFVGGGESDTLGGVYLRVLLLEEGLLCGVGAGGGLLLWVVVDCGFECVGAGELCC